MVMGRTELNRNKAFFLDRDGTINVDYNYVHKPEEWTWCEGAVEAIRWMKEHGYTVIVVTNQSGVVKDKFSLRQVERLHDWVNTQLANYGAQVDDWYIAPYHPRFDEESADYDPNDRKPGTGMFEKAARKHDVDLEKSYMAGDKISDLEPAVKLGITPFFIRSRHEADQDKNWLHEHDIQVFNNIGEVVKSLEEQGRA